MVGRIEFIMRVKTLVFLVCLVLCMIFFICRGFTELDQFSCSTWGLTIVVEDG